MPLARVMDRRRTLHIAGSLGRHNGHQGCHARGVSDNPRPRLGWRHPHRRGRSGRRGSWRMESSSLRWTNTIADGTYTIDDATPGDWSVTISGKDREIPATPVPSSHSWDALGVNAVAQSETDVFSVAAGVRDPPGHRVRSRSGGQGRSRRGARTQRQHVLAPRRGRQHGAQLRPGWSHVPVLHVGHGEWRGIRLGLPASGHLHHDPDGGGGV